MPAKPRNEPRKRPLQARSRATVQALLEATAQLLLAGGYGALTTDLVAERAGASIGTLYQYFPNKEALVAELIRHHLTGVAGAARAALDGVAAGPAEAALDGLIRAGIAVHRIDPALHRLLSAEVPAEAWPAEGDTVSAALQALIEADLAARLPGLGPDRRRLVAFVLEATIEALSHRAANEAPDWLADGRLERELSGLLRPYLAGVAAESPAPAPAPGDMLDRSR